MSETKMDNKNIKKQVRDLLNQIIILTKGVPKPQYVYTDDNEKVILTNKEYEMMGGGYRDNFSPPNDTNIFLFSISNYCKRVVNGSADSAAHYENKYHTSTY